MKLAPKIFINRLINRCFVKQISPLFIQ